MTKQTRKTSLFFAVVLLLAAAMITGLLVKEARAALIYGNGADVQMDMANVGVALVVDGEPLSGGSAQAADDAAQSSSLLAGIGNMDPGYPYAQTIAAANTSGSEEYVRIIVKKYWTDEDGNKQTDLDPSLIELTYGGEAYNTAGWFLHEEESTREQSVYYCRAALAAGGSSPDLFDSVRLAPKIAKAYTLNETAQADGSEITAAFSYDGMHAAIEIEVQSVQAAHAEQAIPSAWGVTDVTVANGRLAAE